MHDVAGRHRDHITFTRITVVWIDEQPARRIDAPRRALEHAFAEIDAHPHPERRQPLGIVVLDRGEVVEPTRQVLQVRVEQLRAVDGAARFEVARCRDADQLGRHLIPRDVATDTHDDRAHIASRADLRLREDPGQLAVVDHEIVGPFQRRGHTCDTSDRIRERQACRHRHEMHSLCLEAWSHEHRDQQRRAGCCAPCPAAPAAPRRLLVGYGDQAVGLTGACFVEQPSVRRIDGAKAPEPPRARSVGGRNTHRP